MGEDEGKAAELSSEKKMEKKECPSCAMPIDVKAKICPICNYEYPTHNRVYQVIAIILLLIFLLFYIF
jgi:predicted amidophosphoribosyltransferase